MWSKAKPGYLNDPCFNLIVHLFIYFQLKSYERVDRRDPRAWAKGQQEVRVEDEMREKKKKEQRFRELKDELINYDFQISPRIKKESFRDLEVEDINMLRLVLIGTPGSGKTSFVGKNRFKSHVM